MATSFIWNLLLEIHKWIGRMHREMLFFLFSNGKSLLENRLIATKFSFFNLNQISAEILQLMVVLLRRTGI